MSVYILWKTMAQVWETMGCKPHIIVMGEQWFDQS